MNRMGLLEQMSWVLGPTLLVYILVAVWKTFRNPPPPAGPSGMNDGDFYFMNEWCDGDG